MEERKMAIPKIIHYCWFGGKELPRDAVECIDSWKKYYPDYKIIEWSEKNFDINICDYVKEAYSERRWAFVSDYARFWILYNYGGLYFDTDVEVIKRADNIIEKGSFMGNEYGKDPNTTLVNPGLGMGAEKGLPFFKRVLDYYSSIHFDKFHMKTICEYTTELLNDEGYKYSENIKQVAGLYIYPIDYFCPMNYYTGKILTTKNTCSIHHYSATWITDKEKNAKRIQKELEGRFHVSLKHNCLFSIWKNLYCYGLNGFLEKFRDKYGK